MVKVRDTLSNLRRFWGMAGSVEDIASERTAWTENGGLRSVFDKLVANGELGDVVNNGRTLVRIADAVEKLQADVSAWTAKGGASEVVDNERALRATQVDPLDLTESARTSGAFFLRVKIDYDSVLQPNPEHYVYEAVRRAIDRHMDKIHGFAESVRNAAYQVGFGRIPQSQTMPGELFIDNPMYHHGDPLALYGMIAHLRPRRIIEVGSGFSTKFMRRAIDDAGLDTELTCVDPFPRAEITGLAKTIIREPIQRLSLEMFDGLGENDIVFWDGSHVVFNGSDVVTLFLEIMPRLKRGVHVHVHDINLPYEYQRGYVAHYYAEQYMLANLIVNSNSWEPTLPLYYLSKLGQAEWQGAAFWLTKTAD